MGLFQRKSKNGDADIHLSSRKLVSRLMRDYIIQYRHLLFTGVFFLLISALLTGGQAFLIQPAIDKALLAGDEFYIYGIAGVFILVSLALGTAKYVQTVAMNNMGMRVIAKMQSDMMRRVLHADISHILQDGSSKLVARFISDSYQVREAVVKAITGMARDAVMVAALIGVMFYMNWQLTLGVFLLFPISVLPVQVIGRKLRKISRNTQERTGDLTALLDDKIRGVRLVKSYCAEDYAQDRADGLFEWLRSLHVKAVEVRSRAYPMMETLAGLAVGVLIAIGSFQIADGTSTPGEIMAFLGAMMKAYQPMRSLANLNASLQQGLASAQRVFETIDVEPTVFETPNAKELVLKDGGIRFDDVSFAYRSDKPVLQDVTLDVPAGSKVALVGPSGAGKSTIFNLLLRLYDATSGTIAIDGQNIRDVTFLSLRSRIALVSQEAGIFNDTVAANIAYGDENPDRDRIMAAARAAEAHDFIAQLEDGYDTVLGEMGTKLSGGQRQRLAIARAVYKDAPILLLDEATSALDSETEALIQKALQRLMQGRTVLMIAHRLSTIMDADIIYVMENGRVVEKGRHEELVADEGLYAKLHAHQVEGVVS